MKIIKKIGYLVTNLLWALTDSNRRLCTENQSIMNDFICNPLYNRALLLRSKASFNPSILR